jgi:hypothetical protein
MVKQATLNETSGTPLLMIVPVVSISFLRAYCATTNPILSAEVR